MFGKNDETQIQEEIRRRVIAEAGKIDKMKDAEANREALSDITSLPQDEVDRIARRVRGEIARQNTFLRSVIICTALFVAALVMISAVVITLKYNKMVALDEDVKRRWAQVENVYQRRLDLIPNLVEAVKAYMRHEKEIFQTVAQIRARVGDIRGNLMNDPDAFRKFRETQTELSGALNRMMVVMENHPDLKADQNILALQAQLEGSENRIAVERKRFNETVQAYHAYIKRFPQVMLARMFGFHERDYFKAEKGAEKAPKVNFD